MHGVRTRSACKHENAARVQVGGIIYFAALLSGFLGDAGGAGLCSRTLDHADRHTGGGSSYSCAFAAYREGTVVEGAAGDGSASGGYGLPVLWDADVDAWFAVLVPDVRSGEELGKFRRVENPQCAETVPGPHAFGFCFHQRVRGLTLVLPCLRWSARAAERALCGLNQGAQGGIDGLLVGEMLSDGR
jgi:hypothetical protein